MYTITTIRPETHVIQTYENHAGRSIIIRPEKVIDVIMKQIVCCYVFFFNLHSWKFLK